MVSPSAMASSAPNRLLCSDPVRYMSVINRLVEHASVSRDVLRHRIERVVDVGLVEYLRSSRAAQPPLNHESPHLLGRDRTSLDPMIWDAQAA